jgi:hypothetical protein
MGVVIFTRDKKKPGQIIVRVTASSLVDKKWSVHTGHSFYQLKNTIISNVIFNEIIKLCCFLGPL